MVDITAEVTSSPRPFVEVLGLWLKVFKMDEAFFVQEGRRTNRLSYGDGGQAQQEWRANMADMLRRRRGGQVK